MDRGAELPGVADMLYRLSAVLQANSSATICKPVAPIIRNDADLTDGCTLVQPHLSPACLLHLSCEFVRYPLITWVTCDCALPLSSSLLSTADVHCGQLLGCLLSLLQEPLRPCSVLPLDLYMNAAVVSVRASRHAACTEPTGTYVVGREW